MQAPTNPEDLDSPYANRKGDAATTGCLELENSATRLPGLGFQQSKSGGQGSNSTDQRGKGVSISHEPGVDNDGRQNRREQRTDFTITTKFGTNYELALRSLTKPNQ